MMRALLALVALALIVVIGLSFVGGDSSGTRREAVAATDQPGYVLTGATITDTADDGVPRMRIEAVRIEQIPADNSVELSTLNLIYRPAEERDWLVTADHGVVPQASKIVRLDGNVRIRGVVAEGTPEAVIETPSLEFDTERSTARTDEDVRVVMGTRTLTAHGLYADLKQRHLRLESRVHGQFNPPLNR
jgi:LPS export ABC transporter protein LptC